MSRKQILSMPEAERGKRSKDTPLTDEQKEWLDNFNRLRNLLHQAARELTGEENPKPDFWMRSLNVTKHTGLKPQDYNLLNQKQEVEVVRAAAKMKKRERVEMIEGLQETLKEIEIQKAAEKNAQDINVCVNLLSRRIEVGNKTKSISSDILWSYLRNLGAGDLCPTAKYKRAHDKLRNYLKDMAAANYNEILNQLVEKVKTQKGLVYRARDIECFYAGAEVGLVKTDPEKAAEHRGSTSRQKF